MQMGRHGRASSVQFAVKVRELAAGVFQEESAPECKKRSRELHKQHGRGCHFFQFAARESLSHESCKTRESVYACGEQVDETCFGEGRIALT
jgi:hypothetical protein